MRTLKIKRSKSRPKLFDFEVIRNNFRKVKVKFFLNLSSCFENIRNYFEEYCSCSGIHGVRYLGEPGRYLVEKVIWVIAITLVAYGCIFLIFKAYDKWETSPVIVTFATKESAIYEIPFPAVTICPEVKSDPEIFNFTDVFVKKSSNASITPDEDRYYKSLSLICTGLDYNDYAAFKNETFTVTEDAIDDILNVLPEGSSHNYVWWLGNKYPLNSTMSQTFTSDGVCYSFNMLHYNDILIAPNEYITKRSIKDTKGRMWTLEEGYASADKMKTIPLRTFSAGVSGGLIIDIFTNRSHLDYLCNEALQGFKVVLHLPSEFPNMDRHFRLPLDQCVLIAVKPRMIKVTEELKSYKAEVRQCYIASERSLTFFSSYTQQNCLDECLSNYTLKECGCIPFYMPKFNSTPICGPGSKNCITDSKISYLLDQANYEMNSTGNSSSCGCLPSCTSIEYDIEISQTDWNWQSSYAAFDSMKGGKSVNKDFDYKIGHVSKLTVFYKEIQFLPLERREVYGYVDIFSSIGGLLGLFIGFSVTSAIEILYFLTLRLACNVKKYGSWPGQHNVAQN